MAENEKRNSTQGAKPERASPPGVGGRHSSPPTCRAGGGYQDICNEKKCAVSDSQLEELRALGLQRAWLHVAALIGVEHFVTMWRVLCQEVDFRGDMQRVYVPRFSTYLRFQRNRVIMALSGEGRTPHDIRVELKSSTGEDVSEAHIDRIIRQQRRGMYDREEEGSNLRQGK